MADKQKDQQEQVARTEDLRDPAAKDAAERMAPPSDDKEEAARRKQREQSKTK